MNQPTTGADVLDYIDTLGLKRLDACWLLGITPWRFGAIINKREQEPLKNPTMAILLRLFEQWPEQNPLPEHPSPRQVFERVRALDSRISERVFGMALGCHPSWASASLDQIESSPAVGRLLLLLMRRLDCAPSSADQRQVVHQWLRAALAEWRGRGDERLDFIDEGT